MTEEATLSDFLDDGASESGEGEPGGGDGESSEDRIEGSSEDRVEEPHDNPSAESIDDQSAESPADTAADRDDAATGDGTPGDAATGDAATADDPAPPDPDADPVATTYAWTPDGRCEACGAAVDRRWCDGDRFVCGECKEW